MHGEAVQIPPPREIEVVLSPFTGRWEGCKKDFVILGDDDIIVIIVPPAMVEGWREVPRCHDQEHEVDGNNQCNNKAVGCCVSLMFGSQRQPTEEPMLPMEQATPADNPPHR